VLLIWLIVCRKEKAKAKVAASGPEKAVLKELCVHLLFAIPFSLACDMQKGQGKAYG